VRIGIVGTDLKLRERDFERAIETAQTIVNDRFGRGAVDLYQADDGSPGWLVSVHMTGPTAERGYRAFKADGIVGCVQAPVSAKYRLIGNRVAAEVVALVRLARMPTVPGLEARKAG
jgi:hypothetical protein